MAMPKSTYVTEGVQSLTKEIEKYNHYSSNDANALCIVAINAPFDPTSQGSFLFNQTAIVIIDIITRINSTGWTLSFQTIQMIICG